MSECEIGQNEIYVEISEEMFSGLIKAQIEKLEKMAELEARKRKALDENKRLNRAYKLLKDAVDLIKKYLGIRRPITREEEIRELLEEYKRLYHEYELLKNEGFVLKYYYRPSDKTPFIDVSTKEEREALEKIENKNLNLIYI